LQTATATIPGPRRARRALSALLIAASIALAGCGAAPDPTTLPDPAEGTPSAPSGYIYQDAVAGYAVTFPGEPTIQTVPGAGTDRTVDMALHLSDPYYMSRGEGTDEEVSMDFLVKALRNSVQSAGAAPADGTDNLAVTAIELEGLPAFTADLTMPDGGDATIVVAGEGNRFYQLVVIGGTPEERQAFFDSFELLG